MTLKNWVSVFGLEQLLLTAKRTLLFSLLENSFFLPILKPNPIHYQKKKKQEKQNQYILLFSFFQFSFHTLSLFLLSQIQSSLSHFEMADEESNLTPPVSEDKTSSPPQVTADSDSPAVTTTENTDLPPPPVTEAAEKEQPPPTTEDTDVKAKSSEAKEDVAMVQDERSKNIEERKVPQNLVSFKEESNRVSDLSESQKNALDELKHLVKEALDSHKTTSLPAETSSSEAAKPEEKEPSSHETKIEEKALRETEPSEEEENAVSIWGIPLLKDERSDVILLKFLRARDFKVKDAFAMIKNTIKWRKEFNIDELVNEDLGDDLEKIVFMHGFDREGHPVCYNVYGEFQNKELYQKAFSTEEKRTKFLRWRIQFLERSIRKLDFTPGGVNTIFQVNDLKNSPGPGKRELRLATKQALQLLQDNYPEFVAKQVN